jgi:ComF family protein
MQQKQPESGEISPSDFSLLKGLNRAWARLVDAVLPPRCPVSGDIVDRQGMLAPKIWKDLAFIAPPFCAVCGMPYGVDAATPMAADMVCAACQSDPPPFDTCRSALAYNDASRALILRFKNGDHHAAVHSFMPWLLRAGEGMLAEADVLVPVPLHYFRLLKRRYNQSALIAQALAKAGPAPCLTDALVRRRATPSQGRLRRRERRENVARAFIVNPARAARLKGKTVILVDDVYTTGSTARECAKALRAAGAARIHVLTLARVVREY